MNLSEYKNEEAVDLLADLLEPVATILADEDFRKAVSDNKPKVSLIKLALKKHHSEVVEIMAILDGEELEGYECSVGHIVKSLLEILNNKDFVDFFSMQG